MRRERRMRRLERIYNVIDVIDLIDEEDDDNGDGNRYGDSDNDNSIHIDNDNSDGIDIEDVNSDGIDIEDVNSDGIDIEDDDSNISVHFDWDVSEYNNANRPPIADPMDVDEPEVINLDTAEPFNENWEREIVLDAPQGVPILENRWPAHLLLMYRGPLRPGSAASPLLPSWRPPFEFPVILNEVAISVDSDDDEEENEGLRRRRQREQYEEQLRREQMRQRQRQWYIRELRKWQQEQQVWLDKQERIKLYGDERLKVQPEFIPEGYVLLMLTGASQLNQHPGEPKRLRVFLVQRQRRSARLTKSNTSRARDQNSALQNIIHTSRPMPPNCLNQMRIFMHVYGVSQKMKIMENNKKYASHESRYNSFQRCHKSLLQEVPELSESGLYYFGSGDDDIMICYCCGTYFMQWQYIVNPWVLHAIRSPNCTLLRLYKGSKFVEDVHITFDCMKYCEYFQFREEFYDLFSIFDLNFLDSSHGNGDFERRGFVIDQMVSISIKRLNPDLLPQISINLNRPPLPNNIICKICYREKIDVLFVPCGHMLTCSQCAVTLHECAVCREPFGTTTYALKVTILEEQNDQLTQGDNNNDDLMCRICKEETIGMAFVPCLHVHTCYGCTITSETCPVCSESYYGLIQVFLS